MSISTNKQSSKVLRNAGLVLGTTLMVTGVGVTSTDVYAEQPKTVQKEKTDIQKGLQIPESLLAKYEANIVATSVSNRYLPKQEDIKIELLDDEGKVVNPSQYTFKLKKVEKQPAGEDFPLMIDLDITLANGQTFNTTAYMPQDVCNNEESVVKVNDINKVNITKFSNNTEEGVITFALSGVREQVFNNHAGVLSLNIQGDVLQSKFNCDATLKYNGKAYNKKNIEVQVGEVADDSSNVSVSVDMNTDMSVEELESRKKQEEEKERIKKQEQEYKQKMEQLKKEQIERENKEREHEKQLEKEKQEQLKKEQEKKEKEKQEREQREREQKAKENNTFPIIEGRDLSLDLNESFNQGMLKLSAHDKEDGDLTNKLHVTGIDKVDTSKEGTYEVKTWVSDKDGAETVKYFKIKVAKPKVTEVSRQFSFSYNGFGIIEGTPLKERDVFEQAHINAHDSVIGNMTDKVVIENLADIDVNKVGEQIIRISVVNGAGKRVKGEIPVKIIKRQKGKLRIEVIDSISNRLLRTSSKYEFEVGKSLTDNDIPQELLQDYKVDKIIVNGIENESLKVPIVPGFNTVTIYAHNPKDVKKPEIETKKEKTIEDKVKDIAKNTPPVITGKDITLLQGADFNLSDLDLKAVDVEDGDISNNIDMIASNVDTSRVGKYQVEVTARDKNGAEVKKVFNVTVNPLPKTDDTLAGKDYTQIEENKDTKTETKKNTVANKIEKKGNKETKKADKETKKVEDVKKVNETKKTEDVKKVDQTKKDGTKKFYQTGEEESNKGSINFLLSFLALTAGLSLDFIRKSSKTSESK